LTRSLRDNSFEPLPALPSRPSDGHKGTFGTVAVVGGCCTGNTRMIGAPALAATGALRGGCGLVKVLAPEPIINEVLTLAPSATGIALKCERGGEIELAPAASALAQQAASGAVLCVGMGLGSCENVSRLIARAIEQQSVPVILDADGLNALAALIPAGIKPIARTIITPHPGEFHRLASACGLDLDPVSPASRVDAARALASHLACVVVLKGAGTIVTDSQRVYVNETGNASLATAGTGDVLAGVIASLVAQHAIGDEPALDLFSAAALATHIHGLAAELWCERHGATRGLLAMDLAAMIPGAIESLNRT
jgi:NAD(P)H-hydrate epimerase